MKGNIIHTKRTQLGLTQRQLAQAAGTSPTSINHWETGKKRPTLAALPALALALGCPIEDLLPACKTPNPPSLTLARVKKRMTAQQVADTLGVAKSSVIRWENGDLAPSPGHRDAYAKLLGISKKLVQESLLPGPAPGKTGPIHRDGETPRATRRIDTGTTQTDLALQAGVGATTIHRWEHAKPVRPATIDRIEAALTKIENR